MSDGGELPTELQTKLKLQRSPFDAEWRDVTQLMSAAAKELKAGQLIHEDDFKLFDSMSALELMDPKMDSGMLVNGAPPPSISARLEGGAVPLEFSSARDVLATLDELFCCEAGWLNGLPLAQSLLTSVYMHRDPLNALVAQLVTPLENIVEAGADVRAVLKESVGNSAKDSLLLVMCAVFLATLKTADLVRDAALRADIYEEEDFSPGNGFDVGVLAPISVEALDTMLQVTQERLETLLEQHKASSSKKSSKKKHGKKTSVPATNNYEASGVVGYELLYPNARVGASLCEVFIRRVQLRRELLATYASLGLAEGALDLKQAREGFHRAYELVEGMSTERLELDPECFSGKSFGFDPSISRLLLSGSPPRDVKIPPVDEALGQMKKVLEEMVIGCSPPEWTCMEDLRIFLVEFSRQQPTIVARSYVLLFLYADNKIYAKYSFMDWLSASMMMNGVPSVLLSTQEGVLYSSRCIETVYESLKVYLHNRSRQRARIEYLLDEWSILQAEATAVDERFTTEMNIPKAAYPRYFTAWSLEESVQLMLHYVVLGMELELYSPTEFSTIYWYLDYLEGSRLQNLNVTWTFVEKMKEIMPPAHRHGPSATEQPKDESVTPPPPPSETSSTSSSSSAKTSKKGKAKHKKHHNGAAVSANAETPEQVRDPVDPTKARFLREIKYTEMLRSLMRAYFQLFNALEREGLVQVKPPMYSTPTIRFQRRFAAFQKLHYPAALTYEDFSQNSDFSPYELELIYKSAEECFKVARAHAEALLNDEEGINTIVTDAGAGLVRGFELQSLLKVCISNCVRLAQRSQNAAGSKAKKTSTPSSRDAKSRMEFDFSIHPHFPVAVFPTP
ncbi:N-alpha-acetyltransferase 35 [Phytophthora cinnamomi]|uniref:N-alpha-acetyltransferase 35 n=1 Tax=Phytophthora cinnamomi TaxID=4785 RepID=UPI00355A21EA|nr:N-alpha-acetyltransferase 35 [Phytophthora cinnamomi]